MRIDWLTVAAQIVNFLVLVWLLRRFLYGPIVRAMEERERRIAARVEEARQSKEAAEAEAERFRAQSAAFDRDREVLLARTRSEAEVLGRQLHDDLREEVERTRREWHEEVRSEKREFLRELRALAVERFDALARRALRDLAGSDLEARIAAVFIDRLGDLDDHVARDVSAACKAGGAGPVVTSAFELPESVRARITAAIHERFGGRPAIEFRTSPSVACGIELGAGGHRVGWSITSYLDALEQTLSGTLAELDSTAEAT